MSASQWAEHDKFPSVMQQAVFPCSSLSILIQKMGDEIGGKGNTEETRVLYVQIFYILLRAK